MKLTIRQLYESNREQIPNLLKSALTHELQGLLDEITNEDKKSIDDNPINLDQKVSADKKTTVDKEVTNDFKHFLKENIQSVIKEKQESQIKRFKKLLPPELETFLEEHFPGISDIHEEIDHNSDTESDTPITFAIKSNRLDIIKALIELEDGILDYAEEELFYETLFTTTPLSPLKFIVDKIQNDERDTFYQGLFLEYLKNYGYLFPWKIREDKEHTKVQDFVEQLLDPSKHDFKLFDKLKTQNKIRSTFLFSMGSLQIENTTLTQVENVIKVSPEEKIARLKFYDFVNTHIKEEDLKTANDQLSELTVDEILKSIMQTLGNKWQNIKQSQKYTAETEQIIRCLLQLAAKFYFSSPATTQKLCYKSIITPFLQFNFIPNIQQTITTLDDMLGDIKQSITFNILEFIFNTGAIDTSQILSMAKFALERKNVAGIEFLLSYHGKLIVEDWKKSLLETISTSTENAQYSKHILLALEYIDTFNESELQKINSYIEMNTKVSLANPVLSRLQQMSNKAKGKIQPPQIDLNCTINTPLFGHIHNDHALGGTYKLQGSDFSVTLKYLYKFLTEIMTNEKANEAKEMAEFQIYIKSLDEIKKTKILPALEIAVKIEELSPKCTHDAELMSEQGNIEEVTQFTLNKLIEYKGNLLIPGGYNGLNRTPGHAMLYEFQYDEKWRFIIRNTGDGLGFHRSKSSDEGNRYDCTMIFELPFDPKTINENAAILYSFIKRLIIPQMVPAWGILPFQSSDIYKEILESAARLGFKQIESAPKALSWIKGQRSGTCAWKVIMAYLKTNPYSHIINPEALRVGIKLFSLREYHKVIKESNDNHNDQTTIIGFHQLHFALQNCSRLIEKLESRESGVSKKLLDKFMDNIKEIETNLNLFTIAKTENLALVNSKLQNSILQASLEASEFEDTVQPQTQFAQTELPQYRSAKISQTLGNESIAALNNPPLKREDRLFAALSQMNFGNDAIVLPKPPILHDPLKNIVNIPKTLKETLDIAQLNMTQGYGLCVIKIIDDTYTALVFNPEILDSYSKPELRDIVRFVAELNALYISACMKQDTRSFPEHLVNLYTGNMLALMAAKKYFNDTLVTEEVLQQMPIYMSPWYWIFFITCNQQKNARMREYSDFRDNLVKTLKDYSATRKYKSFIHAIIASDDKLRLDLLNQAETDKEFNEDIAQKGFRHVPELEKAVYFYLKRKNQLSTIIQFSDLNLNVQLCLQIIQIYREYDWVRQGNGESLREVHRSETIFNAFPVENYFSLDRNYQGVPECSVHNCFPDHLYMGSAQQFPINFSQPTIEDKELFNLLDRHRESSNAILVRDKEGALSEHTSLMRTLANVLIKEETQVAAAIDFMKREFTRLTNKNIQTFIYVTLFQLDLLEQQILSSPLIIDDFISLIDRGIKANTQGNKIKDNGFYFLKLSSSLRETLYNMSFEHKGASEFFSTIDKLLYELKGNYLKNKNDRIATSKLSQLYNYRLWNIKLAFKDPSRLKTNEISEIVESIVYRYNFADYYQQDPFVELQTRNTIGYFIPILKQYFCKRSSEQQNEDPSGKIDNEIVHTKKVGTEIQNLLNNVLEKIGMYNRASSDGEWLEHFPIFRYIVKQNNIKDTSNTADHKESKEFHEKCSINVITGQVFMDGLRLVSLPREVTSHPLFVRFFDVKVMKAIISPDQKWFEFTIKNIKYRFSPTINCGILLKEMIVEGIATWHQYYPLTGGQHFNVLEHDQSISQNPVSQPNTSKPLGYLTPSFTLILDSLPLTLRQFGCESWVYLPPKRGYDVQMLMLCNPFLPKEIPCYYGFQSKEVYRETKYGKEILINHLGTEKCGWLQQFSAFCDFEDPAFLEFWLTENRLLVRLPRYDLEFEQILANEFIFVKDPRYKLDLDKKFANLLPGLKSTLVLVPRIVPQIKDSDSSDPKVKSQEKLSRLLLIPRQECLAIKDLPDHEYYQYEYDIKHAIPRRRLFIEKMFDMDEVIDPRYFLFTSQEKCIYFKLNDNNDIIPESIADRISLAYLYLSRREPKLAAQTLRVILEEPNKLNAKEVKDLVQIALELPANVALDVNEIIISKKAKILSPEFTAVRLLALLILAKQKAAFESIDWEINYNPVLTKILQDKPNIRIANKDIALKMQKQTRDFYENDEHFYAFLDTLYSVYFNTYLNIPECMRLTSHDEHEILRYIRSYNQELSYHEAVRLRKLKLTTLEKEKKELLSLKSSLEPIDWSHLESRQRARLNKIEEFISKKPNVKPHHTKLTQQTVNIEFREKLRFLPRSKKQLLCQGNTIIQAKKLEILDWTLDICERDFLFSFFDFYSILTKKHEVTSIVGENSNVSNTKHSVQQQLIDRIHHHLDYIALRQANNFGTCSLIDNLVIILGFCIEYPNVFEPLNNKNSAESLWIVFNSIISTVNKLSKERKYLQRSIQQQIKETPASFTVKFTIEKQLINKQSIDKQPIIKQPIEQNVIEKPPIIELPSPSPTLSTTQFLQPYEDFLTQEFIKHEKLLSEQSISMLFIDETHKEAKTARDSVTVTFNENTNESSKSKTAEKSITKRLVAELEVDYKAGVLENRRQLALNAAVKELYEKKLKKENDKSIKSEKEKKTASPFLNGLLEEIKTKQSQAQKLEKEILSLANQMPSSELLARKRTQQLSGMQREQLKLGDILHLYLSQDKSYYENRTDLSNQEIAKLNHLTHQFLLISTEVQRIKRIGMAFKKVEKEASSSIATQLSLPVALQEFGQLLYRKRCFDPAKNPTLLLFEYFENKQLYPKQYDYIQALTSKDKTGFISQSIQLIMGGGKSKVLLPLLAQLKACGTHLSIIEVPQSLFNVNIMDLNATTQRLFGKVAQPFIFDDSTPCDEHYLRSLHNRLRLCITNREYLVTTKESMQSFELKYLKLLRFANINFNKNIVDNNNINNDSGIITTLKYFRRILHIFRDATLLIDEVDSTLDVRKQLIHTVGKGEPVPQHEITALLDLFNFFPKINIDDIMSNGKSNRNKNELTAQSITVQSIVAEQCFPSPIQWEQILELIADHLVKNDHSPLFQSMESLSPKLDKKQIEEFKIYLLGKATQIPEFIYQFTAADKDKIALYKEELTNLFGLCMQKLIDEHIGLSRDPNKHGHEREIAIPYIANNIPNETAQFGHYVETLNYTIKIQILKDLSTDIVQTFLAQFVEHAKAALGPEGSIETYHKLKKDFSKLTQFELEAIDIDDPEEFRLFYLGVKGNPAVKQYCLSHHILNYVDKNARTLRSDSQNHAAQTRSVQGMTGTNWNYHCHPPGMKANLTASLGSDGQTIDNLLRHPVQPILLSQWLQKPDIIMQDCFHHTQTSMETIISKMHAWIDLGAYFKGVSNRDVANQFARYFSNPLNTTAKLRYVLYFSDENKLYALPIDPHPETKEPIWLKNSNRDYIQERLQCQPEHYFTYYDQVHCMGTDLVQAKSAHAYVTIGLKTLERDLLQAVMRMREIKDSQRIIFVISKELQEAHPELINSYSWNVNTILKICIDNQINRLAEDHFRSTIQKIRNCLRKDLLDRILLASTLSEQQKLITSFEEVFFTNVSMCAFDQFKHITSKEDTSLVLKQVVSETTSQMLELLKKAGDNVKENAEISDNSLFITEFKRKLNAIVEAALPVCPEKVMQPVISTSLMDSEVQVERYIEIEQENELQTEVDQQFRNDAKALTAKNWTRLDLRNFNIKQGAENSVSIYTLEAMAGTHSKKRTWEFSPHILVSENFMNTCVVQPNKLDAYKKDNLFILMLQDNKQRSLRAMLITPEEAAFFKEKINQLRKELLESTKKSQTEIMLTEKHIWVETLHHTLLAGNRPDDKALHPTYTKIKEEIALFNADSDVLYHSLSDECWLNSSKDQLANKLEFATHVLPMHKDKTNMLWLLRQKLGYNQAATEQLKVKVKDGKLRVT